MNFRKYFFDIILTSYFRKFNLSKISRYTVSCLTMHFPTVGENTKEDVPAGNGNGITQ